MVIFCRENSSEVGGRLGGESGLGAEIEVKDRLMPPACFSVSEDDAVYFHLDRMQ